MLRESTHVRFIARVPVIDIRRQEDLMHLRRLEADSGIFFKLDNASASACRLKLDVTPDRQTHKIGYDGRGIFNELIHLAKMYRAAPKFVVQPVAAIVHYGKVIGYAMERVQGKTLEALSREFVEGLVSRSELDAVLANVGAAFKTLHRRRIGHGDAKASNIMITESNEVVLIDPSQWNFTYAHFGVRQSRLGRDRSRLGDLLRN